MQRHQQALESILHATHSLSLVPRTIRHASKVIPQHDKSIRALDKTTKAIQSEIALTENSLETPEIRQLLNDASTYMEGTTVKRSLRITISDLLSKCKCCD